MVSWPEYFGQKFWHISGLITLALASAFIFHVSAIGTHMTARHGVKAW